MKLKFSLGILTLSSVFLMSGCANLAELNKQEKPIQNLEKIQPLNKTKIEPGEQGLVFDKIKQTSATLNDEKRSSSAANKVIGDIPNLNEATTYVIRDEVVETKIAKQKPLNTDPNVQLVGLPTGLPGQNYQPAKVDLKELKPNIGKEFQNVTITTPEEDSKTVIYKATKVVKPYIVKKGDTLYSISRKNNVPIDSLAKLNKIKPNTEVKIGQKLLLESTVNAKSLSKTNKVNKELATVKKNVKNNKKDVKKTNLKEKKTNKKEKKQN